MKRTLRTCSLLLAGTLFLVGCGGGGSVQEQQRPDDGLTRDEARFLDQIASTAVPAPGQILLADGRNVETVLSEFGPSNGWSRGRSSDPRTPQDFKMGLIGTMLVNAGVLCDRSNYQKPDEGPGNPAQNGLAYLYGGKDERVRSNPSSSGCAEAVYGLDCSGFIHRIAAQAGITIPVGTAALQGKAETWNSAIPTEWRIKMKSLQLPVASYESGDIIGWGTHIGIIDQVGGATYVYQSNGRPGECALNRGASRGPRRIPLADAMSGTYFGTPTSVLRLVPDAELTVKLTWGAQPDVDLHIWEPNGTHVWYHSKQGIDGFLDVDDTQQFGPEHYFTRTISDGTYTVGVAYYYGEAPEVANVVITTGSQTWHRSIDLPNVTGNDAIILAKVNVSTNSTTGERVFDIVSERSSSRIEGEGSIRK